jgi:putative ABC transport system permease protein
MFKDFFLLAARAIAHRKLRSWLTVIGIVIGITAVVALLSIGLGFDRTVKEQVSKIFGFDTFLITGENFFQQGPHGNQEGYQIDPDIVRRVPGVRVVAAVREETGYVKGVPDPDGNTVQGFLPVFGLSPELINEFQSFTGELTAEPGGRLIESTDTTAAVLGREVAERLNAGVGDTIEIEGVSFDIVGILTQQEDAERDGGFGMRMSPSYDDIYIPFDTMTELYGPPDDVLITLVRTMEGVDVDQVAEQVEAMLNAAGGSRVQTVTYSDISAQISTVTSTINAFLGGIAGISLLVGGVGVMNTMFTSVLERTREIGVMKAVGARNGQILSIFLIESGLMGLVGGAVGTIFGLGLSTLAGLVIRRVFETKLIIVASPSLIIFTLLGSFAIGGVAGLWPARRAAKLPVVDALRYE